MHIVGKKYIAYRRTLQPKILLNIHQPNPKSWHVVPYSHLVLSCLPSPHNPSPPPAGFPPSPPLNFPRSPPGFSRVSPSQVSSLLILSPSSPPSTAPSLAPPPLLSSWSIYYNWTLRDAKVKSNFKPYTHTHTHTNTHRGKHTHTLMYNLRNIVSHKRENLIRMNEWSTRTFF